jgi:hypothetical protein
VQQQLREKGKIKDTFSCRKSIAKIRQSVKKTNTQKDAISNPRPSPKRG